MVHVLSLTACLPKSSRYGKFEPLIEEAMKIILFHNKNDLSVLKEAVSLAESLDIQTESFPIQTALDQGQLAAFLDPAGALSYKGEEVSGPSHLFILSSLSVRWFAFSRSFSLAPCPAIWTRANARRRNEKTRTIKYTIAEQTMSRSRVYRFTANS